MTSITKDGTEAPVAPGLRRACSPTLCAGAGTRRLGDSETRRLLFSLTDLILFRLGMGRAAILGGTFDPVHWGHLVLAETALSQLDLEMVIWVPARRPPHKRGLTYEHRRLMVEIAIAGNSAFVLKDTKTSHAEPEYAISTLADLQDTYLNRQWFWIIGLDAFHTLPRWYRREQLIPACDWLVAPRPLPNTATASLFSTSASAQQGMDTQASWQCQQVAGQLASQNIPIRWQLLQMPPLGISSTLIRQYCRQHRSIRYLVPEGVRTYITTHNLYLGEHESEE